MFYNKYLIFSEYLENIFEVFWTVFVGFFLKKDKVINF